MNERIKELAEQAGMIIGDDSNFDMAKFMPKEVKFAELIVKECAHIAWLNSTKDNVSHIVIRQHFGVESQSQFDQEAAAFIAAEDKKVASRYGYFPKLHPSEWQDK